MNFFRNCGVKRELFIGFLLLLFLALLSLRLGWSLLTGGAALYVFLVICSYLRFQRVQRLCEEIERILHGQDSLQLQDFEEGELAILQSQIYKMTVRLREQASALQKDKRYLADSLTDISHQLRTPLTSLHLVASMLQKEELPEERRLSLVQEMQELLSRMDWQIQTLLKISKLDAGSVQLRKDTLFLSDLIQKAIQPLSILMELKEQSLQVDIAPELAIEGDEPWTVEAIGNIVKNCVENTPSGSTIWVTGRKNTLFIQLTIEDNGPGIAVEDLPRLFERFYKGKNAAAQSVGIGLAFSRMVFLQENATVKVENRHEGGARFLVRWYVREDKRN